MVSKALSLAKLLGDNNKLSTDTFGDDVSTIEQASSTDVLTNLGNAVGDQRLVGSNLYIWNGTGWYRIALINQTPTWDSGGQPATSYVLDTDSPQDATVITLAASDPDGLPITYSYVIGGSMDSMATISQDSSIFTITPKTVAQVGAEVELTGSITFRASDGVNILPSVSSFTISFVTGIVDSKYTTLLATATNTGDNSSFTDSSTNSLTLSPTSTPTSTSFSPYRHGGYSAYFNGSGLTAPSDTGTTLQGVTTFTVEFWYNTETVATGNKVIWGSRNNTSNSNNDDTIGRMFQTNGALYYQVNGVTLINVTSVISANTWYYIALVVDQGAASLYLDGTRIGTATYTSANGADRICISHTSSTPQQYITDFRITTDAEYSGTSHTVPSKPLETTANTVLHLTPRGYLPSGVGVYNLNEFRFEPFSPYNNLEYEAANHGGSIYFTTSGSTGTGGGTGQYVQSSLSSELTLDTSDFTISCWVYGISKARDYPRILQIGPQNTPWGASQLSLLYKHNDDNDSICLAMQGIGANALLIASGPIYDNVWYHVAVTRSGSTFTLYINGESVGTYTSTGSATGTGDKAILIGSSSAGDSDFNGYISDLRVINGTVAYTGNFIPPTAPSSSTGAAVHLIGTDASVIDKAQIHNLNLVGGTTGSTTQVKFADTKSMYFDGTDDYVTGPIVSDLNIGTGDFTAECWVYETSLNTNKGIWDGRSTGSTTDGFTFTRINTDAFRIWSGSALITTDPVTIQNTWVHCAVVRYNGTLTIYINGSSSGTPVSNSTNFSNSGTFIIGAGRHSTTATPNAFITGYIQDLRMSNFARYTANFTPPTAPLKG